MKSRRNDEQQRIDRLVDALVIAMGEQGCRCCALAVKRAAALTAACAALAVVKEKR